MSLLAVFVFGATCFMNGIHSSSALLWKLITLPRDGLSVSGTVFVRPLSIVLQNGLPAMYREQKTTWRVGEFGRDSTSNCTRIAH